MHLKTTGITGRDGDIIHKALAYSINAIERLLEEFRKKDERVDMMVLLGLLARGGIELKIVLCDGVSPKAAADMADDITEMGLAREELLLAD